MPSCNDQDESQAMPPNIDRRAFLFSIASALTLPVSAMAETQAKSAAVSPENVSNAAPTLHEVRMLNKSPEENGRAMVFDPVITIIQPGDTVRFIPTDRNHNSASIKGMIPEGADGWNGRINQEIQVTLTQPGFYGYQCLPHVAMGMMGLIIVQGDGMHNNMETAQSVRHRGKAKLVWEEIWQEVRAIGLSD